MSLEEPDDENAGKDGWERIRRDRIKRVPIVRVQIGGLWGKEKRSRKDPDDE